MLRSRIIAAALLGLPLVGCKEPPSSVVQDRPVRTVTVERGAEAETVTLTGQVLAKDKESLAFRVDGRMIERPVRMGDVVKIGQVVARLDAQDQQNALRSAEANLAAAEARLTQAKSTFWRQQQLLQNGWTTRAQYDQAQQALQSAAAEVDSNQAQLRAKRDQLSYTVLVADASGAVTSVGAEPGEVIHSGQGIAEVARDGGRDAVFDVPAQLIRTAPRNPVVEIALANDPKVTATGQVREIAPAADAATRTFKVKVSIADPPVDMQLGSTVTGRIHLAPPPGVQVPATALTEANGHPAVWVVDPGSLVVSARNVDVPRYDPASVVVSHGLNLGDVVVTAGVQVLHPGQKVRLLGDDQ
jgi:RND family efflux transporter MFP subunit